MGSCMRALFLLISLIWLAATGCKQAPKAAEGPIERGVASASAPNDFEPDRNHFDGSMGSLFREMKLMRGSLERSEVLGISTERSALLRQNLYDTGVDQAKLDCKTLMARGRDDYALHHRTADGVCYMHNQSQFFKSSKVESDLSALTMMGARGQRFGRNTPPPTTAEIAEHEKNVLTPNPVEVAQTFFSRKPELAPETDGFQPVPWVNLLASAWLQAENHDWFSHGKNVDMSHVNSAERQQFAQMFQPYTVGFGGHTYIIPRTQPDLSFLKGQNPGMTYARNGAYAAYERDGLKYGAKYRNAVTHWWDASHIYGSDQATMTRVRTIPSGVSYTASNGTVQPAGQIYLDGKIAVDEKQRKLYYRPDPRNDNELLPITGFHDNWWIGLEMIHTIFALEHNKVAEALAKAFEAGADNPVYRRGNVPNAGLQGYYNSIRNNPAKRSDFLYEKARLVVSALIAKIHTVEWTPAILDNPGLRMGMFANWHGLKTAVGDIENKVLRGWIEKLAGPEKRMVISGLTGAKTLNLYRVPFTLTQEFVSVYRMHPLLSDNVEVLRHNGNNRVEAVVPVDESRDSKVEGLLTSRGFSSTDFLYSFGRNKAGLMTLHNYPKFMENMEIRRNIEGQKQSAPLRMNMGATDIVRDRERQTPRYNAFRRALRMRPIKNFEELFITPRVLYEDASAKPALYQGVIAKLRHQMNTAGYDTPVIERDINKIDDFSLISAAKNYATGGMKGVLDDGKKYAPHDVFYDAYFRLPAEEQRALLTRQEIQDIANMKRLYGDVEKLDLLVGTLAEEDRYDYFGFGNTPFYIFALMASRRLMSDPFFSDLYSPQVYSQAGIDWVEKNSMIDVIVRNYPELKPHFAQVRNAFHPWNPSNGH